MKLLKNRSQKKVYEETDCAYDGQFTLWKSKIELINKPNALVPTTVIYLLFNIKSQMNFKASGVGFLFRLFQQAG